MLKNIVVAVGLITISTAYLWVSPALIPDQYALAVNLIAVPFVLGLLAGYLLIGRLIFKLLVLPLIPIAHILIFGGDPAKPGLENVVALVELVPLCIGCVVAHVFLRKKAPLVPTGDAREDTKRTVA